MNSLPPDNFKLTPAFWASLRRLGLDPVVLIRHSGLPVTLCGGERNVITTAEFFSLWRALSDINDDPALGLKIGQSLDIESYHPLAIVALHSRDFRDALMRVARYKQLCCPEEMLVTEEKDECVIETRWAYPEGETPLALIDTIFASLVALGSRGTGTRIRPKRVELKRTTETTLVHETHFGCPVRFRARRNALIFHRGDLDRPFVTHNSDLLEMLSPQLDKELAGRKARARMSERVKWILKRLLAGNRPDILTVARELGVSARTLQRKITDEGASFRQLLLEARKELMRQYLTQPSIEINEAAFLLGYDDPNSFYRAFRTWEGTTPARWRHRRAEVAANRNGGKPKSDLAMAK